MPSETRNATMSQALSGVILILHSSRQSLPSHQPDAEAEPATSQDVATAATAASPASVTEDQYDIESEGRMVIYFGNKHYGQTFSDAYDDMGYRDWYSARVLSLQKTDQKRFAKYCVERQRHAGRR